MALTCITGSKINNFDCEHCMGSGYQVQLLLWPFQGVVLLTTNGSAFKTSWKG
jgi:hypothetical protein